MLYRKSIGGQALQASASSNFRAAHQHGHHPGGGVPGGHPGHGHHQHHLSSSNNHHSNTQNTHDQNEEEGVDVVGLDSSDSAYSHHSKFLLKLVAQNMIILIRKFGQNSAARNNWKCKKAWKFKIEMKVIDVVGLDLSVPTPTTVSSIVMTYDKKNRENSAVCG